MKNITKQFSQYFLPVKALLVYRSASDHSFYLESYDVDNMGKPINAHPLTVNESLVFAQTLQAQQGTVQKFLQPKGILESTILYLNAEPDGYVIWYTPVMRRKLIFKKDLSISDGEANLPAMLWKASKSSLQVYAIKVDEKPKMETVLHHAPFFNVYTDGKVCMGSVDIEISKDCSLEEFIKLWESYFFGSSFSHLLGNTSPVKGNIVQLWQSLIGRTEKFPIQQLKLTTITVKDLIQ